MLLAPSWGMHYIRMGTNAKLAYRDMTVVHQPNKLIMTFYTGSDSVLLPTITRRLIPLPPPSVDSMNISRFSEFSKTQVFNLKSIDRNADQEFQVMAYGYCYVSSEVAMSPIRSSWRFWALREAFWYELAPPRSYVEDKQT